MTLERPILMEGFVGKNIELFGYYWSIQAQRMKYCILIHIDNLILEGGGQDLTPSQKYGFCVMNKTENSKQEKSKQRSVSCETIFETEKITINSKLQLDRDFSKSRIKGNQCGPCLQCGLRWPPCGRL